MSVYTDFQKFVNDLEASGAFKGWCTAQAADCTAWKAYRTGLLTVSPPPSPPAASTPFGKALVDVGLMAVRAGLIPPPVHPPLTAAFSFFENALAVAFTDLSTPGPSGPITGWHWDFGDGNTSNVQNPSHTYAANGAYTVTLTVTSLDGTSATSRTVTATAATPGTDFTTIWATETYDAWVGAGADAFAASGSVGTGGVLRHIVCTTRAQHDAALTDLRAGDWVDCRGITFVKQVNYKKSLAGWAKFTFDSGCQWQPQSGFDAIWIQDGCSHLMFLGQGAVMNLTYLARGGILQYGPSDHIVVDGFVIHGSGAGGLGNLPVYGAIHHCFYRNEVYNIANNPSYDSHVDKGSGHHCQLTGDSPGGAFHDNRVIIYGHDCTVGGGSVLEQEQGVTESMKPYNNTNSVKAHSMMWFSTTQTGGNGVNLYGWLRDTTFDVVEASHMAGAAVHTLPHGGQAGGLIWPNVRVLKGTACNCLINPYEYSSAHPYGGVWMTTGGVQYGAVTYSATC